MQTSINQKLSCYGQMFVSDLELAGQFTINMCCCVGKCLDINTGVFDWAEVRNFSAFLVGNSHSS